MEIINIKKFAEACEDFGGEFYKEIRKYECNFSDMEDYETFVKWLNNHKLYYPRATYSAVYEYGEDNYWYKSDFTFDITGKTLSYETEKTIASPEMLFEDVPENKALNVDMGKVMEKAEDETLKEIDKLSPPYVRNLVNAEIGFNSNYDYYYAKASATYDNPSSLTTNLMKDMDKATETLVNKAEDKFYDEFRKELR